jgi:hypothetical protein
LKTGQRVKLVGPTPDLLKKGIKIGQVGTVRESPSGSLGVEFTGHSDAGWNAGLQVISINTRRDGKTIPVISLCEPI